VQQKAWFAAFIREDLDLFPANLADAAAKGFCRGFFGCEMPRQAVVTIRALVNFARRDTRARKRAFIAGFSRVRRSICKRSTPEVIPSIVSSSLSSRPCGDDHQFLRVNIRPGCFQHLFAGDRADERGVALQVIQSEVEALQVQ